MSDKFNPAPTDKHADDPKQAVKSDKKLQSELGYFSRFGSAQQH
jgi:hypothetical protein